MISSATVEFIKKHRFDDITRLAFQYRAAKNIDLPFALSQIAGRRLIEQKIPSWYLIEDLYYPPKLSLEQCSSEATAKYKSSLVSGKCFVDLTGGWGVDCAFISPRFESAFYVEKQPELYKIARHNFSVLELKNITLKWEDAESFISDMPFADCIFADPARRETSGKKVVLIQDCEPNVVKLKSRLLEKADTVMIKLSPMLDITAALKELPETSEIHIVSSENECKELLFLLKKGMDHEPQIKCVNLNKSISHFFSFFKSQEKEVEISYTSELSEYIYEPNASLLKAGAYKTIASVFQLKKLHRDSHLYSSHNRIPDFPGRKFKVEHVFSFNKTELKSGLKDIERAHISIRNFPSSSDELRKKLKLKTGGDIYLFATTLANEKKILIKCRKLDM
jgi:SAM-dependent methyltransferases related to tRNA (uracil-5-)-methyltransferase